MSSLKDDCAGVAFEFESFLPPEKDAATIQREKKRRDVCQNYQNGECHLGSACPDRHVRTQVKMMHQEVCRHWLRDACVNGENCLYLHEFVDRLIAECTFYQRFGECTNPECFFRHVHPDARKPRCAAYERGFCPLGPDCEYRHVKQEICPFYMSGFCPAGTACKLGHPADKLYDRLTVLQRTRDQLGVERAGDPNYNPRHICFNCLDPGHLPKSCPGVPNGHMFRALTAVHEPREQRTFRANGRLDNQRCFFCGEEDHQTNKCPRRQEPPKQRMHGHRPQMFN